MYTARCVDMKTSRLFAVDSCDF